MDGQKDNKLEVIPQIDEAAQVFLAGSPMAFVFNKIKKLSSAIYLVTNLLNEREPLKWSLRQKSLCLLEELMKHHADKPHDGQTLPSSLASGLVEMLFELELSFKGGLLSEMNARILKTEFEKLLSFIKSNNLSDVHFSKDFFAVAEVSRLEEKESFAEMLPNRSASVLSKGHKGHIKDKDMSFRNKNKPSAKGAAHSEINHDRRSTILKIVKNKGEISVKDVSLIIKGFSEKTIQRELLAMADEGVLKKSGERRWSRYSLAK